MEYLANTADQLGKILRGRRVSLQMTQDEAGTRVGLLQKTVSALENNPERSQLQALLKLLSSLELELVLREKPKKVSSSASW